VKDDIEYTSNPAISKRLSSNLRLRIPVIREKIMPREEAAVRICPTIPTGRLKESPISIKNNPVISSGSTVTQREMISEGRTSFFEEALPVTPLFSSIPHHSTIDIP
jgi:hypothetical protein